MSDCNSESELRLFVDLALRSGNDHARGEMRASFGRRHLNAVLPSQVGRNSMHSIEAFELEKEFEVRRCIHLALFPKLPVIRHNLRRQAIIEGGANNSPRPIHDEARIHFIQAVSVDPSSFLISKFQFDIASSLESPPAPQ
jgi:hypothetical protein